MKTKQTKKKGRKKCVVKRKLKFQDYKHFFRDNSTGK